MYTFGLVLLIFHPSFRKGHPMAPNIITTFSSLQPAHMLVEIMSRPMVGTMPSDQRMRTEAGLLLWLYPGTRDYHCGATILSSWTNASLLVAETHTVEHILRGPDGLCLGGSVAKRLDGGGQEFSSGMQLDHVCKLPEQPWREGVDSLEKLGPKVDVAAQFIGNALLPLAHWWGVKKRKAGKLKTDDFIMPVCQFRLLMAPFSRRVWTYRPKTEKSNPYDVEQFAVHLLPELSEY
jgi:hypothetical protein